MFALSCHMSFGKTPFAEGVFAGDTINFSSTIIAIAAKHQFA
jgi:hypothetical protein